MKKIKVLFIKFMADRYGYGLTNYELKTLKNAHQCDLVVCVPVSQPFNGVEYPYFEVKEFEAKEQSFVDSYENEIESLKDRIKSLNRELINLKCDTTDKVDQWYKYAFYAMIFLFFIVSVILISNL